jgi:hypothetical protein
MSKIITSSQEECIDTQQKNMDTPQDAEIYEYEYEEDEEVSSPYDINDDAYWDVYFEPLTLVNNCENKHGSK